MAQSHQMSAGEEAGTQDRPPVQGVFDVAKTGRASCRACGQKLLKGEVRCGDQTPNPFGEGLTTYWFHCRCAAERRPDVFLAAFAAEPQADLPPSQTPTDELRSIAEFGAAHPRAARFAAVSVAPSGRARCRACRDLIEKGSLRLELSMFQDGRFDAVGYLHPRCITAYVGAVLPCERLERLCASLQLEQRQLMYQCCGIAPSS